MPDTPDLWMLSILPIAVFVSSMVVWITCMIAGALLLTRSGRPNIGFVLGALLGPIGVVVAAIMRLEDVLPGGVGRRDA